MVEADIEPDNNDENETNRSSFLWKFPATRAKFLDETRNLIASATKQMIEYGEASDFSYLMLK